MLNIRKKSFAHYTPSFFAVTIENKVSQLPRKNVSFRLAERDDARKPR